MIKINEIFFSVQGESTAVGLPTVFVRTTGCNLRCTYCDTKYSYYEGTDWTIESVIEKIKSFPSKYVCLTGGEPLLQHEIYSLMSQLCDLDYTVSLETSGSKSCERVDPRVKIILDVKTPDSGAPDTFFFKNLTYCPGHTEFKFVICSEADFDWSERFAKENSLFGTFQVLYSPSHGVVDPMWLAEKMLANGSRARLQLQIHKYIWSPEKRGV